MTETERLRELLDERGVEWDYGITGSTTTKFSVNGIDLTFTPMRDGLVCSTILTPEQAVETTLGDSDATAARQDGAGTCHDSNNRFNAWQCSECGATMLLMFDDCGEPTYSVGGVADVPRYCPNCGAKAVG